MTATAAADGDGRDDPAATLIEVTAPSLWRRGARDVAAEADRVGGRRPADSLARLAREGEHRVAGALGADAASPLAVLDRVGLQREDQGVDRAEAEAEDAVAGDPDRRQRAGARAKATARDRGDDSGEDVGALLAQRRRRPSGRTLPRRPWRRVWTSVITM